MSVIVITGGSAGIGQSAALEVARRGHGVIVTSHSHPEGAQQTVAEISARGGTAAALSLDLADVAGFAAFRDGVARLLADVWHTDTIGGLVNNGGFGGGAAFDAITEAELDRYYAVHFKGPYLLTQTLLPLLADGGAIVSTSSSSVRPGDTEPGYSAYAGMKSALITATRFLARELAPRGIRVNSVAPGPTRTRLGGDAFDKYPEVIPPLVAKTALGRLGEPEDIAPVIAFLLSDDARWITGQDIQVSGGYAL
jgi:NAD(P)-dependent dehydrogenase (short-subunit alcohol dehydrogenase family)